MSTRYCRVYDSVGPLTDPQSVGATVRQHLEFWFSHLLNGHSSNLQPDSQSWSTSQMAEESAKTLCNMQCCTGVNLC